MLTAITYSRVSGEEQARKGYSLPDQRAALARWCEEEGYTIIEEMADEGWSGAYLERPGLDRVRDLVAAGGVDAVVVLFRDRLARGVHAGLLADEFREHGCRLIALNAQVDDSPEGELQGGLLDLFAAYERSVFRRRAQRGLTRRVKQGAVIRGPKPPYGFRFTADGKGLVVCEEEMRRVCWILRETAAGTSAGSLVRELEAEGIPSPSGLSRWNKKTVADFLASDLYLPHAASEVAPLVEPEVAATLEEGRVYGLWHYHRRRTRSWTEREEGEYRHRRSVEHLPREVWLVVPVDITGASVERAVVERAREVAKDRYKKPSTAGGRFWELRGIARCGECGSVLSPHTTTRRRKDGSRAANPYYECRRKWNTGGDRDCDHTRSYPAAGLEELVWDKIFGLISDPDRLRREHEAHVQRMRREMRGSPDREATALAEKLAKLEHRRGGFLDLAADGLMDREELRGKLAEVEIQRRELEEALRTARNRQESIREVERTWSIAGSMLSLHPPTYATASPEDRRRVYQALRLQATVEKDGTIWLEGIFDPAIRLIDLVTGPPLDPSKPLPKPPEGTRVIVAPTPTP